jgi:alpha-methylacyl-CoA racemase
VSGQAASAGEGAHIGNVSAGGPLSGLRVLLLGGVGPSPFCAMLLADLGADIVAIDRAGATTVPDREVRESGLEIIGRGSRRVTLDFKDEEDLAAAHDLALRADVLIEGFRPGVAERLGLGPGNLCELNVGLIYARVTGYGQEGDLAMRAGHDINFIAQTGLLHAIGRRDGPPQVPLNVVADYGGGGMLAAFGICAALWERERSGAGQVVDIAMVDGVAVLMASLLEKLSQGHWRDTRGVNPLDTGAPNYDVYETADGEWMAVGSREPVFHRRLLDGLGLDQIPLVYPDDGAEERRQLIAARFAERTQADWADAFAATDACVSPVLSLTAAGADPPLAARGTYRKRAGFIEPGAAPRYSRTPGAAGTGSSVLTRLDLASIWQ